MNFKDLNNSQINKFPSLFPSTKDALQSSFDLSSEEELNLLKNKEEKYNENNNDSEWKDSIREAQDIKYENICNSNQIITNFNFFIQKNNDENNFEIINSYEKKFDEKNNNESKKCGRKRKRNDINTTDDKTEKKIHDKFSDDNMRKKCKNIVLKYVFQFINNKIKEKYNNDIGHGKFKKELKVINQENKINSTIKNDKLFLNKTLKEIFSEDISARLYNFPKNFNKILIESLIEEDNNEERKEYFNKLFNITFLDCLKYFREDNNFFINELSGFKRISDIKEELINKQGKEYVDMLIYYLKNFQEIINKKQARKNKTKKFGNI